MHKHQCSSLAVSEDSRFLLTAGHNAVKVWDYNMQLGINSQVEFVSVTSSTILLLDFIVRLNNKVVCILQRSDDLISLPCLTVILCT